MMKKFVGIIVSLGLSLLIFPPASAQATTAGLLDGAFSYPGYVGQQFNGSYCAAPNVCEVIPGYFNWPDRQNITQGVVALENWLATHPDSIVVGTSEGAQVIYEYGHKNPTSTQQFVVSGNPERKYGGVFYSMGSGVPPGGQITDVAIQYDFFADYPNNPNSQYYSLAVLNVWFQGFFVHILGYNSVNINDPANTTWTEDNVTYVLVPNQPVFGIDKTLIEDAYIRPTETTAVAAQEVSSSVLKTQSNLSESQNPSVTTLAPTFTQMVESSSPVRSVSPVKKHELKKISTTLKSVSTSKPVSDSTDSVQSKKSNEKKLEKKSDIKKLVKKHG